MSGNTLNPELWSEIELLKKAVAMLNSRLERVEKPLTPANQEIYDGIYGK